jgi:hypothetical protein
MAREEEGLRRARLDKAKDKNRDKRTARLEEVVAEIEELDALVTGIKRLQARGTAKPSSRRTAGRRPKASPAAPPA